MKNGELRRSDQLPGSSRVGPSEGPDDASVVRQVRSGDAAVFEVLVLRYQRPVYNAVRRVVGDPEESRDIAQNVFVKAFERIDSFDERFRFFSWLYRIAIHEALNHVKRVGRAQPLDGNAPSSVPGPDRELDEGERQRLVQEALMTLSPEHRAVLVMRHYLEASYREIAETVRIPEKTVKSRLFEARRALRARLHSMGGLP